MLSFLKALISLAVSIASYVNKKQMLDAGSDIQKRKQLQHALEQIRKAKDAINRLDDDKRKRLREKYNIDK